MNLYPPAQGLYDPSHEHDACGVGFICQMKGIPSHQLVSDALQMLENMNHRGACGCEENSGDGAGILVKMPDRFFRKEARKLGITLPKAGAEEESEYGRLAVGSGRSIPCKVQFVGVEGQPGGVRVSGTRGKK